MIDLPLKDRLASAQSVLLQLLQRLLHLIMHDFCAFLVALTLGSKEFEVLVKYLFDLVQDLKHGFIDILRVTFIVLAQLAYHSTLVLALLDVLQYGNEVSGSHVELNSGLQEISALKRHPTKLTYGLHVRSCFEECSYVFYSLVLVG